MKKIINIVLIFFTLLTISSANQNNIIYENGVKDTLSIGTRYVKDLALISKQNSSIFLDGYAVVVNSNSLPEAKIIQATAIGLKNGLDVKFIKLSNKEFIVFSVEKREADALYLADKLNKYGLSSSIERLNGTYNQTVLVAHDLFKAIQDTVAYLNSKKDDTIKKLTEALESKGKNVNIDNTYEFKVQKDRAYNQIIDLSSLQVVNRVITDEYLKKNGLVVETVKPLAPKEKVNKTTIQKQINTVTKNIKNDKANSLPQITSFSKAYAYLREHAGITKDNQLILHKKAYIVGDKLFIWNISSINYSLGIVVLGSDYTIPLSKK